MTKTVSFVRYKGVSYKRYTRNRWEAEHYSSRYVYIVGL